MLTLYLKDSFTNPRHRTVVLCCVSPAPNDGTLRLLLRFSGAT